LTHATRDSQRADEGAVPANQRFRRLAQ
jgi:hypothetical protein